MSKMKERWAELEQAAKDASEWDAESYRQFYAAANPAAILELLQFNKVLAFLIKDAADCIETAINAGDWKIDGACDPDAILSGIRFALAKYEGVQSE